MTILIKDGSRDNGRLMCLKESFAIQKKIKCGFPIKRPTHDTDEMSTIQAPFNNILKCAGWTQCALQVDNT